MIQALFAPKLDTYVNDVKQKLLLDGTEAIDEEDLASRSCNDNGSFSRRKYLRYIFVLHVGFLVLNAIVASAILKVGLYGHDMGPVYTPAAEVDGFEQKLLDMHLYQSNAYKGPPDSAVDAAWDKLFLNSYIRLSPKELGQLGKNSTLVQDGSGDYLGALDVYHQLHCVRYIFQYVHKDYYTLQKTNIPETDHIDHCIDVLRQVVMCLSDTSVGTFSYFDNYPKTWPEFKSKHTCRNWNAINSWAGQPGRVVDQSHGEDVEKLLRNPNYVHTGHDFAGHDED